MSLHPVLTCLQVGFFIGFVFGQYDSTRSYELQVPGSAPIRIIEGKVPLWGAPRRQFPSTTETPWNDLEHRGMTRYGEKPATFHTKIEMDRPLEEDDEDEDLSEDQVQIEHEDDRDDSMQNSAALSNFLKKYSENFHVKKGNKEPERFDKVELVTKPSLGEDDKLVSDKSKSWNLLQVRRNNYPYEDKKGWVSMDAIPWSVSKVSKWQSNMMNKRPNRYGTSHDDDGDYRRPWEQPHTDEPYSPYSVDVQTKPLSYDYNHGTRGSSKPSSYPVQSASYAQKVYLHQNPDFTEEVPRPWLNKPEQDDHDCDDNPEIITDNRPPNFPSTSYGYHRRHESSPNNEERPSSHPFNGDGEWILLSTTKGFKYPKSRRRSLQIEPEPMSTSPDSISTHKSVRLTVLPPLKNSKVNMTTSHGGLLQVESTFQSVDEDQKIQATKQKNKKRPNSRPLQNKPIKNGVIALNRLRAQTTPSPNQGQQGPDASTVLAAVGAGMIPATMAMLVPLAMSGKRRKRSILRKGPTSTPLLDEIQIQLPYFK